jgi:RimJ/RimL family protein N-acetyltransferase
MAWVNPSHPFLPVIDRVHQAAEITAFGKTRSAAFYEACLHYAQSLWQEGLPARSILALNRALSCPLPLDESMLQRHPLPYQALAWILLNRPSGQFVGNPRRHWQHLATRMVEPNKELRTWRAWACGYLAREILSELEFPPDIRQMREENLCEPRHHEIAEKLAALSPADDLSQWQAALAWTAGQLGRPAREPITACRIRRIDAMELPVVQKLAHRIWPAVYPGIISQAQIDYMLAVWYHPSAMAREMELRGTWFALIEAAGQGPLGYLSFERYPDSDICFINKLYLLPDMHGRGMGAAALGWTAERAQELGCQRLQLRVNKANSPAIRAYQRAGFQFVEDVCTDIGSGFVMDDFRMEKRL